MEESTRHSTGASVPQESVLWPLWFSYFSAPHLIPESHVYANNCTPTFTYPREELPATHMHQTRAYSFISQGKTMTGHICF